MFTGIITAVGKIVKYEGHRLSIRTPFRRVRLGESISINGVCLTVARQTRSTQHFDVGPATRQITTLGRLKTGDRVNLERALRLGDRLGGHWVSGHVEITGRVEKIERAGKNRWLSVTIPRSIARYVVPKGSLAVDGTSLTVAGLKKNVARIMLIPHTLKHTILGEKQAGDEVNLEPDILAKYAEKQHA